jgi:hypothetical protein
VNKTILGIIALCLALVVLLWLAFRSQDVLTQGLPERVMCADQADALKQAGKGALGVLGTGSMAPFIPASPAGLDPLKTIVAYAAPSGATYDAIRPGDLCVYWYTLPDGRRILVIHQAALKDGDGWIMSGYHNARSESWARVTSSNFVAIVSKVYVWNTSK